MKKNNWLSKMLRRATLVCRAARNMKMVRFPQKRVRWEGQTFGGNDKNVTHLPPLEPKNNRDRKINRVISQKFQCSIVLTTGQLNNSGAKNKPKRKQTKTRNRTVVSGLICHLKRANFLAVENKVLILSGVTTYFLSQNQPQPNREEKGDHPQIHWILFWRVLTYILTHAAKIKTRPVVQIK